MSHIFFAILLFFSASGFSMVEPGNNISRNILLPEIWVIIFYHITNKDVSLVDKKWNQQFKNTTYHLKFKRTNSIFKNMPILSNIFNAYTELVKLDLSYCYISLDIEDLSNISNLQELILSRNSIKDYNIRKLSKLKNLNNIDLSHNEISNIGIKFLSELTNLTSINIAGCEVTNDGLKYLSALTNIKNINIEILTITDEGIKHLSQLNKLKHISVHHRITDNCIKDLSHFTNLISISFNICDNITDNGIKHLSCFKNLRSVNICWCYGISDKTLEYISKLYYLPSSR